MNKRAKRRLVVVGGIVIVAMLVIVAIASSGGAVSSLSVADVLAGGYDGKKVQVTGSVVADSVSNDGTEVTFRIAPEDGAEGSGSGVGSAAADANPAETLRVTYDGALPATFGTGVVAICTGTVQEANIERDGSETMLMCTELVTKCPSKYESAEGSLTVKGLLDQADTMVDKETKVCGYVRGEVNGTDAEYRFIIESQDEQIAVVYDGGLDEQIVDGAAVVVTGHLTSDNTFVATEQPALDTSIAE